MNNLLYFLIQTATATYMKEKENSDIKGVLQHTLLPQLNNAMEIEDYDDMMMPIIENIDESCKSIQQNMLYDDPLFLNTDLENMNNNEAYNFLFCIDKKPDILNDGNNEIVESLNAYFKNVSIDMAKENPSVSMSSMPNITSHGMRQVINSGTQNITANDTKCGNDFCFLLSDVLKNVFYYRFNIQNMFQCLKQSMENLSIAIDQKNNLLLEFIEICLNFVSNKQEFIKTDDLIYTSNNSTLLKAKRQEVIDKTGNLSTISERYLDDEYQKITECNNELEQKVIENLQYSSYAPVRDFICKISDTGCLFTNYYDMCVCLFSSLYRVSLFFDTNLPGVFEQHMICPPEPLHSFYTIYTSLNNNSLFYWAIDWLYYFSNYDSLPKENYQFTKIESVVSTYTQSFFVQLLLFIHFAMKYEIGELEVSDLECTIVNQLKEHIYDLLFSNKDGTENSFFKNSIIFVFDKIERVFSHKVNILTNTNKISLIRTTEEHIAKANTLTPSIAILMFEIYNLLFKAHIDLKKELLKN